MIDSLRNLLNKTKALLYQLSDTYYLSKMQYCFPIYEVLT